MKVDRQLLDHLGVLNAVGKYLARRPDAPVSEYCEAWRFPMIGTHRTAAGAAGESDLNRVTFVWRADAPSDQTPVSVVGTFDDLWRATPLDVVMFNGEPTAWRAVTVLVPKGQVHTYKFLRDRQTVLDPINPQRKKLDDGIEWSRFFTDNCATPISFERWELAILMRLTNEILPFNSPDARDFLDLFYFNADREARGSVYGQAYRLEQPIGAVNFIDNVVAREERHRLIEYKLCLGEIARVLRKRFPGVSPEDVTKEDYKDLYEQMGSNVVENWDTAKYKDPNFFLQLLRRHTFTGAFSHPKYGGNAGGAGWAYLEWTYQGPNGEICFDWKRAIERPLGDSADYFG